jgi:hypothetical protein
LVQCVQPTSYEYGTIDDLRRRLADITFIIFNYDRCIEHYLFHAFKTYYDNLSPEDAGGLVNSIQIFHPYGSVGSLPWIQNGSETVSFGESCDPRKLFGLAGEIRTFTEGTDLQSSHVAGLRQSLEDADQVVFLGFHFHKLNLDLLRPRTAATPKSSQTYKVFATAKNFKGEDRDAIRNDISKRFAGHVRSFFIDDCTCAELFDRNKVTLAFD